MTLTEFINICISEDDINYEIYAYDMFDEVYDELRKNGTHSEYDYIFSLYTEQMYKVDVFLKPLYALAEVKRVIFCDDAILIFIPVTATEGMNDAG